MKEITIKFENCYGIGSLEHSFDFSKTNTYLIYAPNGTMKTSLAKTFKYFAKDGNGQPCDQIYPERQSIFEITIDNNGVTQPEERILIIDPDDAAYDASNKISNFVASKDLKDQYEKIYQELDEQKNTFIKKLKTESQSTDCEDEIISTFGQNRNDNFFQVIDSIFPLLKSSHKKFDFRYNDIFDKKGNVKKFLEKNRADLQTYVSNYESLLEQSSFFKKSSKKSFGTHQASEILKSVEDESFFEAGHALDINDGDIKINTAKALKELVDKEINKIVDSAELKKVFDKVDKAIGSNVELRTFKAVIEENNLLLVELSSYEEFKKKTWLGYLSELKGDTKSLYDLYAAKKQELNNLFIAAKKELEIWKTLVGVFNERFHVPFTVELSNQEDIILKKDRAVLSFIYADRDKSMPIKSEKDHLFGNVLSRGERRAFYILQMLFEIESRKTAGDKTLIIFDDVADSFDYKNKYAIIEYIRDLENSGDFRILLLTHNFDFYRTIASRLNLPRSEDASAVLMASRREDGSINLNQGQYVKGPFQHFLKNANDEKVFVSLISFLRNLIEYTEGMNSSEYALLTSCLHLRPDTNSITVNDVVTIWNSKFPSHSKKFQKNTFLSKKIIDLIFEAADAILNEHSVNEIFLENKIVLSIAIRLKAEGYMISNISNLSQLHITSNQTQALFTLMQKQPGVDPLKMKVLNKVILMTPENIHLNAFMYEPLIDISIWHLLELYKEVKGL